ncbi:hypothetical protein OC835_002094 [Tilletia horrida]|nr:hypothetical protein OC835_002094 [Tilletia horrida]
MPLLLARPVPARVGLDFTKALFTPTLRGGHLFLWGTLWGAAIWQSTIGAYTAFKALPRRDFGRLQAKIFPVYGLGTAVGTGLLAASFFAIHHGRILKAASPGTEPTVLQTALLGGAAALQALNHFVYIPRATRVMFKRHALEAAEGKDYSDPTASAQMKGLSTEFSKLHGVTELLNLSILVALTVQGFWLANFGL